MKPADLNKIVLAVLIASTAAIVFFPSLFNDFVGWDDPLYVTENEVIRGISAKNIIAMFTGSFGNSYCPFVILSYSIEYQIAGLNPFLYHFTNYILHIFITVLVFWFICLITRSPPAACITALLFGIHPLHVESVSWVTERKDLLCAIFYVPAMISYYLYVTRKRRRYFLFCAIFSLLALLSKPMAVTLPVVFLLLDYLSKRRLDARMLFEKIPFFFLSLVFGYLNMHFQDSAMTRFSPTSLWNRAYFVLKAIPFYLSKVFVPVDLSAMYSYHPVTGQHRAEIKYYVAILVALAVTVFISRKRSRTVVFGSALFVVSIAPVLQLIPTGNAFAADRYMYLPSIGVFLIIADIFVRMVKSGIGSRRVVRAVCVAAIALWIVILGVLSWKRSGVWKDSLTFYEETLKTAPESPIIHNNLAKVYYSLGRNEEAVRLFKRAGEIAPNYAGAFINLGNMYNNLGLKEEAVDAYRQVLRADPEKVDLYVQLGLLLSDLGRNKEAVESYLQAIEIDPRYTRPYGNLGALYGKIGRYPDAVAVLKKAISIDPDYADAHNNLAVVYYSMGEYSLSIERCDRALALGHKAHPRLLELLEKYRQNADISP